MQWVSEVSSQRRRNYWRSVCVSHSVGWRDEMTRMWHSSVLLLTGGTAGGRPRPSVCLWCSQAPAATLPQRWYLGPLHPSSSSVTPNKQPKRKRCSSLLMKRLIGVWPTMTSSSPSLLLPSSAFWGSLGSSAFSSQFWVSVSAWIEVVLLRFQKGKKTVKELLNQSDIS